ncbi:MAG: hypothetical protein H7293_08985 [Candidatus Saccharibacteria bacterium]|nr:hypothetical protein [Rhodoferax sp.]
MTYRQTFDHLGNPVAQPTRPDWQHRTIQVACIVLVVVFVLMLIPTGR